MKLELKKYAEALAKDPEFNREIRYYDGAVKMIMGNSVYVFLIKEGKLVDALDDLSAECPADLVVEGTDEMWSNLLAKVPRPFYQCLQTTCVKHGMKMSNDVKSLAYLPAWNRMIKMLREMRNA